MLTNINAQCHLFSPCISLRSKKAGDPNFVYYIFVLLCVLHIVLENQKKIISTTYISFLFSAHTSEKYMFEKMEKTRLSQGNEHQWFLFAKIPYFLVYIITRYAVVLRFLSKTFINGKQNFDCFSNS